MATFPKLVIVTGPDEGREFELPRDEVSRLGRAQDNRVALVDSSVSRRHAAVAPRDGKYFLQDLESRNGTFWQGQKLATGAEQELKHLDVMDVGIYQFRFLEHPASAEELAAKNPEMPPPPPTEKTTPPADQKPGDPESQGEVEFLLDDIIKEENARGQEKIAGTNKNRRALKLVLILLLLAVLGATGFWYREDLSRLAGFAEESNEPVATEKIEPARQNSVPEDLTQSPNASPAQTTSTPGSPAEVAVTPIPQPTPATEVSAVSEIPVFLDIKTRPLPATVYFNNERLGLTPLRETLMIKPGQTYEAYADFELRDISDIYRKKISFEAKPNTDVIELDVQAEIGVLKIMKLPRHVEFYLEGFYEYDSARARPVKISDIIYGKPVYLPYGKYRVELREWGSVSGSENKISQIKYQREYMINATSPAIELSVTDESLREFPVVIKSDPSNATVIWNGQDLGKTPFTGSLPIGENRVILRKDGYFEKTLDIAMRFNSIFETLVTLETSRVGELINDAKAKIRQDAKQEAINQLVEALKYGGTPVEKAEVYLLLGDTYLAQAQFDQAGPYFEKARSHPDFAKPATLGLARVKQASGDVRQALALIVEVLVNLDDKTPAAVRAEANSVFKKLSPIKSVIYVYTDPPGADVFLNDKKLAEVSPVILSDLGLGTYRIELEKAGYETYQTRQNLKLGEFALIKVKLRKLQF